MKLSRFVNASCLILCAVLVPLLVLSGCTTITTLVTDEPSGAAAKYRDSRQQSALNTYGIESSDLHTACSVVTQKIAANPLLCGQAIPPHLAIEPRCFEDETQSKFNVNLLVDLLRTEMFKAAQGQMVLVDMEAPPYSPSENVGPGTTPLTDKSLGVDYELCGRIADITQSDDRRSERYTQIAFHVTDVKTGQIVFHDVYYFKKAERMSSLDDWAF